MLIQEYPSSLRQLQGFEKVQVANIQVSNPTKGPI